ncbi:hypothetical protein XBO1_1300153 [Xenorhabdus bovienii str. oregonense]|uniref:Uncharacterized protein n=1 Tax=Xenorhabdus bovienii str. oregonense TaxID=1398202 RepID=A0A077P173_XENBV|nr:hypothetical protein XBO1_1300153 [Xenorhabdus bovienii str. oregonense]
MFKHIKHSGAFHRSQTVTIQKLFPLKNEHFTFLFYIICIYSLNEIVVFPNDFICFFL